MSVGMFERGLGWGSGLLGGDGGGRKGRKVFVVKFYKIQLPSYEDFAKQVGE